MEIKFAQPGTQIHYTLNNESPTVQSAIYTKPIHINQSFIMVKALVSGDGFLSSEIVSATFIKDGFGIKSVQQSSANAKFSGSGANTLIDNKGGATDLHAPTWLGYQQDSVVIEMELQKKQSLSKVLINCLQNQGSWIFLPKQILVYYFDEGNQLYQVLGEQLYVANEKVEGASCQQMVVPAVKKVTTKNIKIILKGIKELPEWHVGKGQKAWVFIDEIKVY